MTAPALHVHIERLVVGDGFDRAAFERALAQSFSQPPAGGWTSQAIDRLRVELATPGGSAAEVGDALAAGLMSLGGAPQRGNAGAWHDAR